MIVPYIWTMRRVAVSVVVFLATACAPSREVPKAAPNPVEWSASAGPVRRTADGSSVVDIALKGKFTDGWHVYSLTQTGGGPTPMSVTVSPPYEMAGAVSGPAAVKAMDAEFGVVTETYAGQPKFTVAVKLPTSFSSAITPIEIKVRSQACSDKLCLPARTTTLNVNPTKSA